MSIQSLSSKKSIPFELQVETVLFLDLQSLSSVAQLNKSFHAATEEPIVWTSLMDKMKMSTPTLLSSEVHPKTIMINLISNRVTAFSKLKTFYPRWFPQNLVSDKPLLIRYKAVLNWFVKNPEALEEIGADEIDLDETYFNSLIDMQAHPGAHLFG